MYKVEERKKKIGHAITHKVMLNRAQDLKEILTFVFFCALSKVYTGAVARNTGDTQMRKCPKNCQELAVDQSEWMFDWGEEIKANFLPPIPTCNVTDSAPTRLHHHLAPLGRGGEQSLPWGPMIHAVAGKQEHN